MAKVCLKFLGKPSERIQREIQRRRDSKKPLCFTAVDAGAVVQLKCEGTNLKTQVFQTSTDKINWTDHSFNSSGMLVNSGTSTEFVLTNSGDKIYFRSKTDNTGIARTTSNYLQFTTTYDVKLVDVSGSVMSLLSPDFENLRQVRSYQFYSLFSQNTSIRGCDKLILPSTTLAGGCYSSMFSGCTSLTSAPALPAETLASWCYEYMFQGCTSLTQAPELPATTLATGCYVSMFSGCTSLTSAPALPATTLTDYCYSSMLKGCTSLTTAPSILPSTTLAGGCYQSMFSGCTSLTSAPALPVQTLTQNCYSSMFYGCSSLTSAPELPAQTLARYCYFSMFQGCTSLSSAPALPATTLTSSCYSSMFEGCTSLSVSEQPKEGRIEWTIPSNAITATDWNVDMFTNTGGDFTGNPVPGIKYYIGE